jgi:hypothetical protein
MYERLHRNGAVARVTCTTFLNVTSYQATSHRTDTFGNPIDVRVETGYETLEEAQEKADALAHDGCVAEGCAPWRAVSRGTGASRSGDSPSEIAS